MSSASPDGPWITVPFLIEANIADIGIIVRCFCQIFGPSILDHACTICGVFFECARTAWMLVDIKAVQTMSRKLPDEGLLELTGVVDQGGQDVPLCFTLGAKRFGQSFEILRLQKTCEVVIVLVYEILVEARTRYKSLLPLLLCFIALSCDLLRQGVSQHFF